MGYYLVMAVMVLLLLRVLWLHAVSISSRLPCGRMLVLARGSRNIHADNTLGTIVWGLGLVRTEKRTLSKVVNNHASVNGRFNIRANAAKQASCIAARTSEKWPKSMDLLCTKKIETRFWVKYQMFRTAAATTSPFFARRLLAATPKPPWYVTKP